MVCRRKKEQNSHTIILGQRQKTLKHSKAFVMATTVMVMAGFSGLTALAVNFINMLNAGDDSVTYERMADPSTMEDYLQSDVLGINENSRNAGRIWTDKTVFAKGFQFDETQKKYKNGDPNSRFDTDGTLSLDAKDDGSTSEVKTNTDFLQAFSALGSSQVIDQYTVQSMDVVLLLDVSSSMTKLSSGQMNTNDSLHQVLDKANKLVNQLMNKDPEHPVASDNRVGVVVYGGGSQEVLPLGHYDSATNDGTYMKISGKTDGSDGTKYFPVISSNVNGTSKTTQVMLADSTYLQGALYQGLKMLADEKDTTYKNPATGTTDARRPILITLTDGATNMVSTTKSSNGGNDTYDWWQPFDGIIPVAYSGVQYSKTAANPYYADCNESTGYGADSSGRNSADNRLKETEAISARNVSNLLLAGYYKNKIEANYGTDMKGFSIGFNTNGVGEYASEQLLGTLNPKEYFREGREINFDYLDSTSKVSAEQKEAKKAEIKQYAGKQVDKTKELLTQYINNRNPTYRFPEVGEHIFVGNGGHADFTWKHPADSENDVKSLEDVYYIDEYYAADDSSIEHVFDDIFDKISVAGFVPIEGSNDSGVSDSLIYMDPIGEYMEVKDDGVTVDGKTYDMAALLFEKMHGLEKTGVYDYKFSSTHRGPEHNSSTEGTFQEGWYDSEGKLLGYYNKDEAGNVVGDIVGTEGSFANGDTYYFGIGTIRRYVSTLSEDEEQLSNQEKNTVYTAYRFADAQSERLQEMQNPCYEKKADIKYSLSDFRIWVEDTGDFTDEQGSAAPDLGYHQALYINIPSSALPIMTADISVDTNGDVTYKSDVDYLSNMKNPVSEHVTPFRLFYGVGLSNEILENDGRDIDVAKLDKEYMDYHKHKESGDIYFLSNYFSDTQYDHYVSGETDSERRGDASSTFSPASINRYYIFQKPLTLYKLSEGDELNKDGNGQPIYTEKVLTQSEYDDFVNSHKDNVIKDGDMDSDAWYWIVGDYYTDEGLMHLAVTRKGSEFGSAIGGGEIEYGEYLVWYNPEGEGLLKDNIRDYNRDMDTPPDDSGNWVIATKPGGLRVGDLSQMVETKEKNVTGTANTVTVPIISTNTTKDNIVVDNYHGNNGKIVIPNKLLQVTKEVETDDVAIDPEREFDFEVRIANYTGAHEAIVLVKNPYSKEWQLRMDTINIVTDNHGLLQKAEHSGTSLATVKKDGRDYYVYVGAGADDVLSDGTYLLYDQAHQNELAGVGRNIYVSAEDYETLQHDSKNNMRYMLADDKNKVGSIDYWVEKVYLIPAETDLENWNFDQNTADASYQTESQFVISHLDSTLNGMDQLSSNYLTKSAYLTQEMYFGYDKDTMPEEKPEDFKGTEEDWAWMTDTKHANTAKFTLKSEEGLEFVGLNRGNDYDVSVVEVVEDHEVEEGYTFERVEDNESGLKNHEVDKDREDGSTGYKVSGSITDRVEEHYINRFRPNYDLTIDNTVLGSLSEKEKEWTFRIKLTPEEFEKFKTDYIYQKCTVKPDVREDEDKLDCQDMDKKLSFEFNEEGGYYEAELKLKDGDIYRIKNIDSKTSYEVTEDEAGQDGYDTVYKFKGNYHNYTDLMNKNRNVGIINARFAPADLSVAKKVEGSLGDVNRIWHFKIELFPDEGYVLDDKYKMQGLDTDELEFTKNEDGTYSSSFELMHGQDITIKDLPEGLRYKVTEDEAGKEDYITTVENDNAEGSINTGGEATKVDFVNAKYDSRKLAIGKRVEGSLADTNEEFTFNVTLTPNKLVELKDKYPYVGSHIVEGAEKPEDGEITLTKHTDESEGVYYTGSVKLKHGQIITIEGLPEGTQYLIEEEDVSDEGYITRVPNNNSGMLTTLGESVIFVNDKSTTVDLNIEKQVVNGNAEDENRDWNFEVYLTAPAGVELDKQYSYTGANSGEIQLSDNGDGNLKGNVTLKHGQTITINDLPEGTRYEIKEVNANQNGFISGNSNNTSGVLAHGNTPTVKFTNIKLEAKTLNIGKMVLGENGSVWKNWTFNITLNATGQTINEVSYNYTGGTFMEGVEKPGDGAISFRRNIDGSYSGQITLRHGQYITISGLEENATYEVQEVENGADGYTTFSDSTNGAISSTIGSLVLYNNMLPGAKDLTLSKIVHGASGFKDVTESRTFTFKVSLTPIEYVKLAGSYHYDGTKAGELSLIYNAPTNTYVGYISGLTHNDTVTIHGLPEKTKYEISEEGADDYIQKVDGRALGKLYDAETKVTYNNTKSSDVGLSIKKNVGGNLGEKERYFKFNVVLTAPDGFTLNHTYQYEKDNGEIGTLTLTKNAMGNLEGVIEIKDGETATIKGLPEGTKYMVDEEDLSEEDYITTNTGNTRGVINSNGLLVEFNNWKSSKHKLTVEKKLEGDNVEEKREWNFEVTLNVDPGVPNVPESYAYVKNDDESGAMEFVKQEDGTYRAEFKLKGGEDISIEDLPYDTEYSVVEKDANVDNYKTTAKNEKGALTKEEHKVVFTNERNKVVESGDGKGGGKSDGSESEALVDKIEEFLGIPNTADEALKYILVFGVSLGGVVLTVKKIYRKR